MSEACLAPGCERRRMTVGALCGPHSRDDDTAEMYDESGEEGTGTVTTLQEYREQQADPDPVAKPVVFACPEPGCEFVSTRPQGLSRHRNQSHGIPGVRPTRPSKPPKAATAKEPHVADCTICNVDLTADEVDVLDAVAFLDDTTREKVLTTIVTRFIAEQPEYVTAFARKRGERRA